MLNLLVHRALDWIADNVGNALLVGYAVVAVAGVALVIGLVVAALI
jgi:hypothetical protein